MRSLSRIPLAALLIISFSGLAAPVSNAQAACDGKPRTVKLGVHGKHKAPVSVKHDGKDASKFKACIGDTIVWRVPDDERTIIVEFPEDAPFVGHKRLAGKNGKVKAVINNAEKGKRYRYFVEFKNGNRMEAYLTIR